MLTWTSYHVLCVWYVYVNWPWYLFGPKWSIKYYYYLWVEWLVWRESSVGPWDCLRCWGYLRKTSTNQNFQSSKACCSEKYYNTRYMIFVGQTRVIFTLGQLWPSGIVIACICVCVYVCVFVRQSSVCPAQATITKIGPKVLNTLVKTPIVFGVHWPWPSRSNQT